MLYKGSEVKVRVNNEYSDKFRLLRGTRQGCPMSPLLFTLIIEPLAVALRSFLKVIRFRRGITEQKVALYADDLLLFLGDTQGSLLKAMEIITNFGQFSGLIINWENLRCYQ